MIDDSQGTAGGVLQKTEPGPGPSADLAAGKGLLPRAPEVGVFDPLGEVENLLEDAAMRAHLAGLELIGKVCSGLPRSVVGDVGRLRQVLGCLVDNAIRFTARGEVVVEVDQARDPSGEGPVFVFQVRDTGRGMAPDQVRELIQGAEAVENRLQRTAQLVVDLGGRLEVESVPEQGSTFRFMARFSPSREGPAVHSPQPPAHLVGLRALVADDNPTARALLAEQLRSWGLHPTQADGGHAALEVITEAHESGRAFAVVLMDARMPRLGGFSVTERLVEAGQCPPIVMLVSPPCRRNDDRACERLRISDRVTKPIRRDQLLRAVIRATAGL